MEEVKLNENLNINDLEELLNKYFLTLEEQDLKLQEELERFIKEDELLQQEEEVSLVSEQEFRTQLLVELSKTNENIQYNNNLLYWAIVITGTILICTLLYKVLKIFI